MKMYHVVGKDDVSNIVKHIKNENQAISIKSDVLLGNSGQGMNESDT